MSAPVIARTEQGFAEYVREHQRLFDALKTTFPTLYAALYDSHKAAFYGGADYEARYERAENHVS